MPRPVVRLLLFVIRSRPSAEIIVVALGAMLLLAIAAPAMLQMRERARRHSAQDQLLQLGVAFQSYHETFLSFPTSPTRASQASGVSQDEQTLPVSPLTILIPIKY